MSLINPNSWSVKVKLYGTSVAMLTVMLGLVGFGVIESKMVGDRVAEMNGSAADATHVQELDKDLETLRRAILRYAYDRDEASWKLFEEVAGRSIAQLQGAEKAATSPAQSKEIAGVQADVAEASAKGAELFDVAGKVEAGKVKLTAAGDNLSASSTQLVNGVMAESNALLTLLARKLDSQLLSVRVANWRNQATGDAAGVDQIKAASAEALRTISLLEGSIQSERSRGLIGPLKAALADYVGSAIDVVQGLEQERAIYRSSIAPAIDRAQTSVAGAKAELANKFAGSRSDVDALISGFTLALEIFAVLVLVVGAAIAVLVVRAITKPLLVLTQGMRRLADGDFDVVLPGLGRSDEIGEIAGAVEVFKVKSLEKARLEADEGLRRQAQEAEALALTAAERERVAREQDAVMSQLGAALTKLAKKNLTYRLDEAMPEAYRKLQSDFNTAIGQLEDALKNVGATSDGVQTGAREISRAAGDLSGRTEQQASHLEETAAALAQITSTVRKTAEGAGKARDVVAATRDDAEKSGEIVRRAVEAMGRIEKSSAQISQIIGVIDEIAFQTNLLALNAGVEAARAGEAGRGFAVVASEVRALAQRSAEAAKEIKGLISTSSAQVGDGVELVAVTGKSLERILTQVAEINAVVIDIAASAQEQAVGLEQVNSAVNQMDQMTQQNAAMAEEAMASSQSLSQDSEQLSRLMAQFEIGRAPLNNLRAELQKAAPHAFRSVNAKATSASPKPALAGTMQHRSAATKAASAASTALAEDWTEF